MPEIWFVWPCTAEVIVKLLVSYFYLTQVVFGLIRRFVLETELSEFPLSQLQSENVLYCKKSYKQNLRSGIRVSSVDKVRFKIIFYDSGCAS